MVNKVQIHTHEDMQYLLTLPQIPYKLQYNHSMKKRCINKHNNINGGAPHNRMKYINIIKLHITFKVDTEREKLTHCSENITESIQGSRYGNCLFYLEVLYACKTNHQGQKQRKLLYLSALSNPNLAPK